MARKKFVRAAASLPRRGATLPAVNASPSLKISLLGPPRISLQGRDISTQIKYRKGLALLAYLAVQRGRWVARGQLAELLWPALPAAAGLTNLRQVLNTLTWVLNEPTEGGLIRSERERVGLFAGPELELDLALLDAAEPGVAEPRLAELSGLFMEGFSLRGCADFEHWLQQTRQELGVARHRLLTAVCQHQQGQGRLAAAAVSARRLWELDLLDEGAAARLIILLLDCGDRRGAQEVLSHLDRCLVAELGTRASAAVRRLLDSEAPALADQAGARPAAARAVARSELRWLTLLYIAFEAPVDADEEEEGLALLPPLMQRAQELLRRWGGLTQWVFGAGFHASFGGQTAPEHGALRSLLAAQALQRALGAEVGLRIGICAGQALCTHTEQDFGLVGELPGRAQAFSAEARVGQIVLGHEVREQLGARLQCQELPPGATRRHLLLGGAAGRPIRPAAARGPRELVGREQALDTLQRHWQLALQGQPQWLVLRGEAGLGKTALATSFARRLKAEGVAVRYWRCELEHQHQSLAPLRLALAQRCGIAAGQSSAQRLERLVAGLRGPESGDLDAAALQACAQWLDRLFEVEPEAGPAVEFKNPLFAVIFTLLDRWCEQRPGLLCVDDLHWSDLATRELLSRYAGLFASQRLLLLVTARPEIALEVAGTPPVFIDLAPLSEEAAQRLAERHDAQRRLAPEVLARVARQSGGIPLYIECLARGLLDGGAPALLPVTELLQAELDRLGSFKPVLQAAAVIGQHFDGELLARLLPGEQVEAVLQLAEGHRLIVPGAQAGHHAFRHALIHEAAYASLPPLERRRLHGRLLELRANEPGVSAVEMARHCDAARQWEAALQWWRRAGREALAQEFAADALRHFERALALALDHGGPELQAELRLELAVAALQAQGYGSPLAYAQFGQVSARVDAMAAPTAAERDARFIALSGQYMGADSHDHRQGPLLAQRLEALASTPAERLMACFAQGNSLFWQGRFAQALRYQQEGAALALDLPTAARQRHTGDDLGVLVLAFQCWTLWFLGRPDEAHRAAKQGLALARAGGKAHALCFMLSFKAAVHWSAAEPVACLQTAGEGLALAGRHGFPLWQGINGLFCLAAQAQAGELDDAAPLLQAAQTMRQAYQAGTTTARWIVASSLMQLGRQREVEALLEQTLAEALAHGQHYCRADLLQLLAGCRADGAEALRHQATALAREQGALGLLARWGATAAAPDSASPADPALA